jgi:hypothetical protein
MIRVSELTGAQLDYWTGKADKVNVAIRNGECTENLPLKGRMISHFRSYRPSEDWSQGGPLQEKHKINVQYDEDWHWMAHRNTSWVFLQACTPLEAICRAVVRAAFGDEVEEVAA